MKLCFALLIIVFAGCEPLVVSLPTVKSVREPTTLGSQFDPSQCGTIAGTVTWTGDVPNTTPFVRSVTTVERTLITNPHSLAFGPGNTLAGAVVALRDVDPARSKPWDHAPARVELNDHGITIHQDNRSGRVGFVKLGDEVAFHLASETVHGVRVRGDAFFGLILTSKQQTATRRFPQPGQVSLSSASGLFWASAELFVMAHPYITLTDANGHFGFTNVPAGEYELVVTHPNPAVTATEIDPESSLVVRQTYGPAYVNAMPITVKIGTNNPLEIHFEPQDRPANLLPIR